MSTQVERATGVERRTYTARLDRSIFLSEQTKHLEFTVEGVDEF
jgi:hypothetical protein